MKKEKNLALIYSAVGHALMHMFAAFYFVIVLAIEKVMAFALWGAFETLGFGFFVGRCCCYSSGLVEW